MTATPSGNSSLGSPSHAYFQNYFLERINFSEVAVLDLAISLAESGFLHPFFWSNALGMGTYLTVWPLIQMMLFLKI
jgi:hypothetical protein